MDCLKYIEEQTAAELDFNYTLKELKEFARELTIKGRSKMNKLQLAMAIEDAANELLEDKEPEVEEPEVEEPTNELKFYGYNFNGERFELGEHKEINTNVVCEVAKAMAIVKVECFKQTQPGVSYRVKEIRLKRPTAKQVLKAIYEDAKRRRTYVVINDVYAPWLGSFGDPRRLAQELGCNDKIWSEVYKLNKRYSRFKHYCQEVKPQWREVERIHFADNSIEAVEVNKNGESRQVMIEAPHGDACY